MTDIGASPIVEVLAAPYAPALLVIADGVATITEVDTEPAGTLQASITSTLDVITAGPQGPQGPSGAPGPAGAGVYIEQRFAAPASTWTIAHGLSAYPIVTVVDINGDQMEGDVAYPDVNTVVVTFAKPYAGIARLRT